MTSLITTVRSKFLGAIRSVNPQGRWKILVVDEHSQQLLSSVLKQYDILEENVTLIESISSQREPQQFEAIYLLMSTSQNVERIIRDYSGDRPQYTAAHLFFLDGLNEGLFQRITSSAAEPYLRTLQELYINYWALESQAFTLKQPDSFFNIYSPPRNDAAFVPARNRLEEQIMLSARMIANVCISLNEFPYIRYYLPTHHAPLGPLAPNATTRPPPPPEGSGRWRTNLARGAEARAYESAETDFVARLLAFRVQEFLEEFAKGNPEFPKSDPPRPRATLIITDRTMDIVAPFLHEFTYQAMANDLLPIEDGTKYMYKFQTSAGTSEDKTAILSDLDNVWTDLRHMHMREAIDKLMEDFNKFMQENAGYKGGEATNLDAMKDMLANLPQFADQKEKFSLHLNMAEQCMNIFEKDKLPSIANVEQNCATGLTSEGKTPKTLVEEMVPLLDSRDIHNSSKVRIIALYIQHRDGVPDEDRRRLYQHARLSLADQDAINALVHLGARISRNPADKDTKKLLKHGRTQEDEYDLSRYKPLLKTVIESVFNNRLDSSLFPYVKDSPSVAPTASPRASPVAQATSLRSQKPSWHRQVKPGGSSEIRQRLLVFVAGGMTYSEMREAYLLSKSLNKDIIVGSTHVWTPRQFVDDLKVLELGGVGSRVAPNGIGSGSSHVRPPQEYYDMKYTTKDAPAPRALTGIPSNPKSGRGTPKLPPAQAPPMSRPTPSNASSTFSVNSTASHGGEEKKKKKGLFRF